MMFKTLMHFVQFLDSQKSGRYGGYFETQFGYIEAEMQA